MCWIISILFLFFGLFTNGSDLLHIGLLLTSGLFAIAGSIESLASKFNKEVKKENEKTQGL